MTWKAGPEKPRTKFCWVCSREFHGRVHTRVKTDDGAEHDVHKACVSYIDPSQGYEVVYESTTAGRTTGKSSAKGKR